uniref:Uncharacterized protein n=1 Tax=Leersia perrieri TaxID=77586 RepID=A0A0D9WM10_9ORYZ
MDDLARRLAAFIPLPNPPQKDQLSGVAAAVLDAGVTAVAAHPAVLDAGGRLTRTVGDVFRRLRIDDGLEFVAGSGGTRASAVSDPDARIVTGGFETIGGGGVSGRFARPSQGSMNMSATYDSRTSEVESSVVARGDLWRAEASHSSAAAAASPAMFMVQLGPVLFVRDTTLLFPVHLSKRHLIWYGFERKNGVHSVCPAYWSAHRRWFFMSMICLNPFTCSFMDMQFPNGQLRYVAGDGFTTRAFLPLCRGIFQAHGKFPGEKKLSYSFKNRSGGSLTPMVQWPDKSFSLGIVQTLSWKRCGLIICPTFGGSRPGLSMELIHSVNENAGFVCGYSHTASPYAYASISIGRSKLNGSAASSGLVFRVDAPLHNFGRPWFSIQMNSGLEF